MMFRRADQSPKSPGLACGPFVTTSLVMICACADGSTATPAAAKAKLIAVFIMTRGLPLADELPTLDSMIPRRPGRCLDDRQHPRNFACRAQGARRSRTPVTH